MTDPDGSVTVTSTAQRMRGLAALVALVALIGGVPWGLWALTGGAPWEGIAQPSDWLTSELTTSGIVAILALLMWAAWAYFVVCVAVEIVRAIQHRPATARGVGAQPLARRLVASVLLLVGTATATAPVATASTGAGNGNPSDASISRLVDRVDSHLASEVSTKAGGGGADRATPTAREAQATAYAKQGLTYLVQPPRGRHHDCLWDIAERTLGDGTRWTEIYALNKGKLQADGNRLADPDLIYPGWQMILPDDAKGPNVVNPSGRSLEGGNANGSGNQQSQQGGIQENGASSSASDGSVTMSAEARPVDHSTLYAQLGLGGGLIAAGLLWGLRRQRGWNGGDPPGRGRPFQEEHRLRLGADRPAALFADRAFRTLGAQHGNGADPAARPSVARLNADTLAVRFTAPAGAPAAGWSAGSDAYEWTVRPELLRPDSVDGPSAAPQMVCIGVDGADQVLVNLAAAGGVVSVSGDRRVASEMARSIVIDLVTHAWADVIEVLAVGFPEDLLPLGGGRLRQFGTVDEAVAHVRGSVQHRLTERVIVSAVEPSRTESAALVGLSTDRTKPVGVLVCGDVERAGLRLSANADGVVVPAGWNLALSAQRLPAASIPALVSLYGQEPVHVDSAAPGAVPGYDARLADPAAPTVADVRLLGPLAVDAVGEIDPDRRAQAAEIVAYVALHPEGVHQHVLTGALWPRGASDDVVAAAMDTAERWLTPMGGSPALALRESRWQLDLSRVRVDWHVLQMCRVTGASDVPRALDALRLVTGAPLSELPPQRYSWITADTSKRISETIVDVAETTAVRAAEQGRAPEAVDALRLGLRGVPDAEILWRRLLRLTAADGTQEEIARVADEMFATLARCGSPRGPEGSTVALVDDLLPNRHREAADLSA